MSEEFKLAAEVKLKRRLKSLQRINENREIDRTFISCAEYQLFLDEKREKKEFYQPDHWLDFHFPKGSALQPIAGVRAPDVEKFCDWLSQKEHKKYRCPTLAEAQEFFALENQEFATWCNENRFLQWDSSNNREQRIKFKVENLLKGSWAVKYFRWDKFALARPFVIFLAFVLDLARALDLALARPFALARALARALALLVLALLDLDLARTIDLDLARTIDLVRTLKLALDLARTLARDDNVLQNFLKKQDYSAAQQYLQQLQPTHNIEQRKKNLLTELLAILTTDNKIKQQQAWRRYIAYLVEYAVIGYEMLEKEEHTGWQRLLFWRKVRSYAREKEIMAELYAWTKIVEARQKGELPAWEGIRIVRERDV